MKTFHHSRLLQLSGLLLGTLLWLANNLNPPCGSTEAPFDGSCASAGCHGTANINGFDGTVLLDGLPSNIQSNTTYPLTLTVQYTAGSPVKSGFQIVAVAADNSNAGSWTNVTGETSTAACGGRNYIEQHNGKVFLGNAVTWNFTWTSPASANGNQITFYYIGSLNDGDGTSSGDWSAASSLTLPFTGASPVTAFISNTVDVTCNGGNNGSATVEPGGGTPPYTFHWSNGQTTQTAINLTAGTYTVTVTGSGGSGTATAEATINQPPPIVVTANSTGTVNCSGSTATGTVSATGGNDGFTYLWSNGQTGSPVTFTTGGVYTVTATDSGGCTKTATVTAASNGTPPTAVAAASGSLTCTVTSVQVDGTGSSTGTNFTYHWTTVNGNIVSGANNIIATVNAAGTYTLLVTNSTNGCTKTASATVTGSIQAPNATATGGTLNCTNTSITITGSSTTPGVTYSWSGPNGFTSTQQNPAVNTGGTYTLTVLELANNCTATATAVVSTNTTAPTAVAAAGGQITCSTATVAVNGTGSSTGASITYLWTTANGHIVSGGNTISATVDVAGTYTLKVTDTGNGCTATASATITSSAQLPNASATGGTLTCAHLSIAINGNSTTPGVTFSWAGPNGFSSAQQNPTVNTGGTYTLTVLNPANGCSAKATAVVDSSKTPPGATATAGPKLTCAVTSSQVSGNSPVSGVTFAWTGPNGFTSSQQKPSISAAGLYTLIVKDTANGCTSTATVTASQDTTSPGAGATGGVISCNMPTITLHGTTNSTHPKFAWSGPGGNSTQQNFTVSVPGVYKLVVTDSINGCSSTASATVTGNTIPPTPSVVTIKCPPSVTVSTIDGNPTQTATYNQPVSTTDCPCTGLAVHLTGGLASGSPFPVGVNTICFTAKDSCGQTSSCCFTVKVLESSICDVKTIGCMKYELLTITQDAAFNKTYRIRVTSTCATPMVYAAFQLPNGLTAVKPHTGDIYTSPDGRDYLVTMPNFSPFYSTKFQSQLTGISGGASDIFKYTLPPVASVTYIHVITKVEPGTYYEAYLNTFYCPVGVTVSSKPGPEGFLRLFPNPTHGNLFADLSAWAGERLHLAVFDSRGQQILETEQTADYESQEIHLPSQMAPGLYFLRVMTPDGRVEAVRFVVE